MLIALDRKAFEHALTRWAVALLSDRSPPQRHCRRPTPWTASPARGSFDGLQKAVHLLSLLAHESGLTLARRPSPTAVRTRPTSTKPPFDCSKVWSPRASGHRRCHLLPARFLPAGDRCGGRLPGVRQDNQPTLLNDIRMAFAPPAEGAFSPSAATNLGSRHGHGDDPRQGTRSIERRTLKATTALNDYQQFPACGFRPENTLVLISHFANSLRTMLSRILYLTTWANGVTRHGTCFR